MPLALLLGGCMDDGDDPGPYTPRTDTTDTIDVTRLPIPDALPAGTLGEVVEQERLAREAREAKVLSDAQALGSLLNDFWARELNSLYGMTFDPPARYEYYYGEQPRSCGGVNVLRPNNAYYCLPEHEEHVAFDLGWFEHYLVEHPRGATTFIILAHEWGHAVQDTWVENGGGDVWNPPHRQELNADCLAGVFIARSIQEGTIVEEVGDAEAMFDWLYEAGTAPWLDPGTHGTRDQRQAAFREGVQNGTDYCRTTY